MNRNAIYGILEALIGIVIGILAINIIRRNVSIVKHQPDDAMVKRNIEALDEMEPYMKNLTF